MGGVDDEKYAEECYELARQLKLDQLLFTGRVDVVKYMEKLDFTILTSISEGQPLSVLESLAATRPCDDGCGLLPGAFGRKGGRRFRRGGVLRDAHAARGWRMRWRKCAEAGDAGCAWKRRKHRVEAYYRQGDHDGKVPNSV